MCHHKLNDNYSLFLIHHFFFLNHAGMKWSLHSESPIQKRENNYQSCKSLVLVTLVEVLSQSHAFLPTAVLALFVLPSGTTARAPAAWEQIEKKNKPWPQFRTPSAHTDLHNPLESHASFVGYWPWLDLLLQGPGAPDIFSTLRDLGSHFTSAGSVSTVHGQAVYKRIM